MTQARAVPRPAGRLALAGGLALAVAVALYALGRVHTPDYAMGLLGHHGVGRYHRQPNGVVNLIDKRAWIFGPGSNWNWHCTPHE